MVILKGTKNDDLIIGSSLEDDFMFGFAGNDEISSDGGNDFINGGAGQDLIDAGSGDDIIIGGPGSDLVRHSMDSNIGCTDLYIAGRGSDTLMLLVTRAIVHDTFHDNSFKA